MPENQLVGFLLTHKREIASARFRGQSHLGRLRFNNGVACDVSILDLVSQVGEPSNVLTGRSFSQKPLDDIPGDRAAATFFDERPAQPQLYRQYVFIFVDGRRDLEMNGSLGRLENYDPGIVGSLPFGELRKTKPLEEALLFNLNQWPPEKSARQFR